MSAAMDKAIRSLRAAHKRWRRRVALAAAFDESEDEARDMLDTIPGAPPDDLARRLPRAVDE